MRSEVSRPVPIC